MAEYIKREDVEKFIEKGLNNPDKSKAYGFDAVEILSEVHFMPAADVAEVVSCKDCKYLMFSDFYGECSKGYFGIVTPDDFCSRGERKDGEG